MKLTSWLIGMHRDESKSAHDQLFFALNKDKQDWSSREGNRLVQFVELQGRIIARVNQKPLMIPCIPHELMLKPGMALQLSIRVMRNKTSTSPPYNYRPMSRAEIHDGLVARLEQKGFTVTSLDMTDGDTVWFKGVNGKRVLNPSVDTVIQGSVHDIKAFANAWYHGIGRRRTYGFGMIREKLL